VDGTRREHGGLPLPERLSAAFDHVASRLSSASCRSSWFGCTWGTAVSPRGRKTISRYAGMRPVGTGLGLAVVDELARDGQSRRRRESPREDVLLGSASRRAERSRPSDSGGWRALKALRAESCVVNPLY
jgi:hypothetical protein